MRWTEKRRAERHLSRAMLGVLAALTAFGLVIFYRELPALRRYVRIARM